MIRLSLALEKTESAQPWVLSTTALYKEVHEYRRKDQSAVKTDKVGKDYSLFPLILSNRYVCMYVCNSYSC